MNHQKGLLYKASSHLKNDFESISLSCSLFFSSLGIAFLMALCYNLIRNKENGVEVYFITDGCVIANELLTISEKMGKRQISMDIHEEYVKDLIDYMAKTFNKRFVVIPDEDGLMEWSKEHGDYFDIFKQEDKEWFVKIKDGVEPETLRKRFRAGLPYESWKTFIINEPKLMGLVVQKEKVNTQPIEESTREL